MIVPHPADQARIAAVFSELLDRGGDLRPALMSMGEDIRDFIAERFDLGSDPWGAPWAPLSAVTLSNPRRGTNAQPLRDTGRLANSIQVAVVGSDVLVGTNVPYAPVHQFGQPQGASGRTRRGGPIPWGDIPARAFFPIRGNEFDPPEALADELIETIRSYFGEALAA